VTEMEVKQRVMDSRWKWKEAALRHQKISIKLKVKK